MPKPNSPPPIESPRLEALPEPCPEAILREQLSTITQERDTLQAKLAELQQLAAAQAERIYALEENTFSQVLANMDAGSVLTEAGEQIRELIAAVHRRENKGRFALSITVKPFKGEALVFVPEIRITEPKAPAAQSVFYASEDGTVSLRDPRQRELTFGSPSEPR